MLPVILTLMSDANRVSLNPDGYIEATIVGDQTKMSFEHMHLATEEMMVILQQQGKRQLGLIDVTNQGKFSAESNKEAMLILEKLPYEKIAIFSANKVLAQVINVIILAMGKSANTRLFGDRQSALAWLQETSDS
jgi:hypothetical protein